MNNCREYIQGGQLCIQRGECRVWFTLAIIEKHIVRLEKELAEWQRRRAALEQAAKELDHE